LKLNSLLSIDGDAVPERDEARFEPLNRNVLQEFQYGNDMSQTTTNISKKVHRNVDEVRELYSLHK